MKLTEIRPSEKNPRQITKDKLQKLQKSISDFGKMMELRPIVVDTDGNILGWNMRYRAIKALGMSEIPNNWVKVAEGLTEEEKRRFVIEDNVGFGEWDWDVLANEWDDCPLADWGVDVPEDWTKTEEIEDEEEPSSEDIEEYIRLVEPLIKEECERFLAMADSFGVVPVAYAKRLFLRAKYLGERYPRFANNAFTPIWEHLNKGRVVKENMLKGYRSLTTLLNAHEVTAVIPKSGFPWGGGRQVLDFPVEVARKFIKKYGFGEGTKYIDPCHGWVGRLTAAMLENVAEYVGFDPSETAHEGVERQFDAFKDYSKTNATFCKQPFEDASIIPESFNFCLTCPPYFDVEIYEGEETSTERYKTYQEWLEGFLKPLATNVFKALKKESFFCIVVGSQKYPLKKDTLKICEQVGFNPIEVVSHLTIGQATSTFSKYDTKEDGEVMLVFQKN